MKAAGCFPRRDSKELLGAMVSEEAPALRKQITRTGTSKQVGELNDLPCISPIFPPDLLHISPISPPDLP